MFVFFPFYFICWVQTWNNLISQAGQMALHGTPNDLLQNLDPIALCIFIPLLDCEYRLEETENKKKTSANQFTYLQWAFIQSFASLRSISVQSVESSLASFLSRSP